MKVSDLIQNRQMGALPQNLTAPKTDASADSKKFNFGDTMKDFLNAVNEDKIESGKKVEEIIQGKSENLAEAMSAVEESSLSFQLMLEIRNKLVQSFQEINRMPI